MSEPVETSPSEVPESEVLQTVPVAEAALLIEPSQYVPEGMIVDKMKRLVQRKKEDQLERERLASIPPKPFRREEPRIGRNESCPCGSGKKFKKCHMGRESELNADPAV